jgi:Ca-activated chloride channel family protein
MIQGRRNAGERSVTKAIALPVLLLMITTGSTGDQAAPAKPDQDPGSFRVSVEVDLVVLHATVTDPRGGFVAGLAEQDFAVYEDGARQHIRVFSNEDIPVTVGLVVDHSSTMRPKLAEVTAAARTFVRSSNREDEIFVVNFNERVAMGLSGAKRLTNNTDELETAITAGPIGGQTALYDAIAKALDELQAGSRERKVLIVISDGGDNASVRSLAEVMQMADRATAVIYTVGLFDEDDADRNPAVLKRLARATGGEAFLPNELSEVVAICARIARDIRHQYTIGYVPVKPARDGVYHSIRVAAQAQGHDRLSVRTRAGYIAGNRQRVGQGAK